MKLRDLVIFLMLLTVFAPIVLYTDTLGVYFTSSQSKNELMEDVSTFTFSNEVRPLNVLPQESSTLLKEPLGAVFLENSINSTSTDAEASSGENAHTIRQLNEESLEGNFSSPTSLGGSDNGKNSSEENPIIQVTGMEHEKARVETVEENTKNITNLQHSDGNSEKFPFKSILKRRKRSSRNSVKALSKEQVHAETKKRNEPTVFSNVLVQKLKDQIVEGNVYLSLSVTKSNPSFMRDLRMRMGDVQRALGSASRDSELPKNANDKLKAMEQILLKGKQIQDDCTAMVKKLRQMLHSTDDQLQAQKQQNDFLVHLTSKTIPKGLHCLPLRLSTEYFMSNSSQLYFENQEKLDDPKLYHYALFSDNVLAAAVVVNSTITNAKDPSKHVFHVVTDGLNYAAMKMWFLTNPPGQATIQVQNVEEFTWLNSSYSPVLEQLASPEMVEYYFNNRRAESDPKSKFRNPKYLSIMNHLRFYLPEIFPKLHKILFLDDDVVVQKDLTGLFTLDLLGKVIGVVETCVKDFHRFDKYLIFDNPLIANNFDPRACGWAFGMNIFDLDEWRKHNLTQVYHKWQSLNHDRKLWRLGTLPPGLITFWRRTHPLNKTWHVLGLGYESRVDQKNIERAAVIHYNGNLKPWLEIGIPKFRNYWAKYVNYDQVYLRECNVTP